MLLVAPALAAELHQEVYDARDGVRAPVQDLALDARGRLWAATGEGLLVLEGDALRPAPVHLSAWDRVVAVGDEIWAVDAARQPWRITPEGAVPVAHAPFEAVRDLGADDRGRPWVVDGAGRAWIGPDWQALPTPGAVVCVDAMAGLLAGAGGLWRSDGSAVLALDGAPDEVLGLPDGRALVRDAGRVRLVEGGAVRTLVDGRAATVRALARGPGVAWAALDGVVLRVDESGVETLRVAGLERASGLLVDGDGGLWTGAARTLVHLPAPEVYVWRPQDGLPRDPGRFLAPVDGGVVATSWYGLGGVDADGAWTAEGVGAAGQICVGPDGVPSTLVAWTGETPTPARIVGREVIALDVTFPGEGPNNWAEGCVAGEDGVWHVTRGGLVLVPPEGPARWVAPLPFPVDALIRTKRVAILDGELWLTVRTEAFHARIADLLRGAPSWSREAVTDSGRPDRQILALQPAGGTLWALSRWEGLLRRDAGSWERVGQPVDDLLLTGLHAEDDGLWLLGARPLAHVDAQLRPTVTLSAWHGVPPGLVTDAVTSPDGSLWVAADGALVHLPPATWQARPDLPVRLEEILVDDEPVAAGALRLSPGERLEVTLAVDAPRASRAVRYRLRDGERTVPSERRVALGALDAGHHALRFEATVDGRTWSSVPAALDVEVLAPWWRRTSTWVLAGVGLLAGFAGVARVRERRVRREAELRERFRHDLHDTVAATLAAMELSARTAAGGDRADAALRGLADQSARLRRAVVGIDWSLRDGSARLDALSLHLLDHARSLFAHADLRWSSPRPLPEVPLRLEVVREIQLVVTQALDNAARHAGAKTVWLTLAPVEERWSFTVRDDGRGFDPKTVRHGLGLDSMRARASRVSAGLTIVSGPSGTTVTVVFDP
ncbi:MAG: hypothetical protein H6738_10510 [Alphaproteobacteria bacterium]|nr:hypothetical protein [Alphaproteobacteria bacterium]MCB9697201.1 hypothetical protein [Alphaproteobacteria bacterium]